MHANEIIQIAIMILKNGGNKSKKSKTCVKHFVYFTSSVASSRVELNKQIIDIQPHLYVHKQRQILYSAEMNLELDKWDTIICVEIWTQELYASLAVSVCLNDVDLNS